jgi:Na+-driven multidrug efflux pump
MIGVFIDDPNVVREGVGFLRVIAPFWAFFGGTMVIQGAFRGAGQTKVAMALSFLSRWVFRVPIALLLAFPVTVGLPATDLVLEGFAIGVTGIWVAFSSGALGSFLVAAYWFRRGRWTQGVIGDGRSETPVADRDVEVTD